MKKTFFRFKPPKRSDPAPRMKKGFCFFEICLDRTTFTAQTSAQSKVLNRFGTRKVKQSKNIKNLLRLTSKGSSIFSETKQPMMSNLCAFV